MILKKFCTFIMLTLFLNALGQPIEKSGTTELEKKVETYIIGESNPKFYHTIVCLQTKVDFS